MTENQHETGKVYELGVNFVSSLAEEQVPAQFDAIKSLIEKAGGSFISEEAPKLRQLAYTMVKNIQGKNYKHDRAYFGWVKFELESEKINDLKETLDRNDNILRYIIVKTVKENTLYSHKLALHKAEAAKKEETTEVVEAQEEVVVSDEELDKTIDDLVS